MKPLVLAASVMLLSACSTTPSTPPTPVPRPKPVESMAPAQPLPQLDGPTAAMLARWISRVAEQYGECRDDKAALIEWIGRD